MRAKALERNQVERQREPQLDGYLEILLYEKIKKFDFLATLIRHDERQS